MAVVFKEWGRKLWGEINRFPLFHHQAIYTPRQAIDQWCSALILPKKEDLKGEILITAIRNYTWIEWAVYAAFVYRQMGYKTTLLYRLSEVAKLYPESRYFNFWEKVKQIPFITLVDLDELAFDEQVSQNFQNELSKEIKSALAYNYHIESENVDLDIDRFRVELKELNILVGNQAAKLDAWLKHHTYQVFLCFSGLINETPGLLKAALRNGLETACIEGWGWRQGHMIYHFNAPALEYNVSGWMNFLGPWNEKKEQEIQHYFDFLENNRKEEKWLSEVMKVQQADVKDDLPTHVKEFLKGDEKVFLLACNVVGDSSMLNRETIFESQQDLVRKCIDYFKLRPDLKLIIRAHPGETVVAQKVGIFMGNFAQPLAMGLSNVLVVHNKERLNTFSLVPYLQATICWISSVGVDMVIRGVPTIVSAHPKYSGLGIVEEPKSRQDFFNWIDQQAIQRSEVSEIQKKNAKEYLYLIFKGFSFEAFGKKFRSFTCKLNQPAHQKSHDEFYQILVRAVPAPDETKSGSHD